MKWRKELDVINLKVNKIKKDSNNIRDIIRDQNLKQDESKLIKVKAIINRSSYSIYFEENVNLQFLKQFKNKIQVYRLIDNSQRKLYLYIQLKQPKTD